MKVVNHNNDNNCFRDKMLHCAHELKRGITLLQKTINRASQVCTDLFMDWLMRLMTTLLSTRLQLRCDRRSSALHDQTQRVTH